MRCPKILSLTNTEYLGLAFSLNSKVSFSAHHDSSKKENFSTER